ncbi:ABC transporter ATP-binding protein [Nesterenkonia sp. MY13]|uniref:ABC transporter ATP-binding protein n=1 Tax=Nesterenkonia sedimenti TaxID=1463632 RepID=A0A7X8TLB1_9MICC|nr:ABC transporter ATP-binding protein [Nesterenkonia sedimenti]NLS10895.1 ABC transporter ATP-binding protein [Nesterenkonia sedimenti]
MTETATTPAPAVTAQGLTKTYGSGETTVHPLRRLSLNIPTGVFTAIMGPSGSGKSTLLHVLAGLDTADQGEVALTVQKATGQTEKVQLTGLSERDLTLVRRQYIGFIFQSYNLVPAMTARENILLPSALGGPEPDRHYYEMVIDRLGLTDRLDHRPFELSGGQQQRVAVARALVAKPAVIFADEPTGNLDSRTGAEVLGLLRAAVDEFGQTVVMVTHDANAAAQADQTVILSDGRVLRTLKQPTAGQLADTMIGAEG